MIKTGSLPCIQSYSPCNIQLPLNRGQCIHPTFMTREQRFIFLNLVHGPFLVPGGGGTARGKWGIGYFAQHDTSNTGHSRNTFPLAGMMMPIGFHIFWDGSTPKQIEGMSRGNVKNFKTCRV